MSKIIVNVPHSSFHIPDEYRDRLLVTEEEIAEEHRLLVDIDTDKFFNSSNLHTVRAPISRLICDTERFSDDSMEEMASVGRGMVYTKLHSGKLLRQVSTTERDKIMRDIYVPHHELLTKLVDDAIQKFGEAIIIDCHSFIYEADLKRGGKDLDVCIGTDDYHTPGYLIRKLYDTATNYWPNISFNTPYSGTVVPLKYLNTDNRVKSIMIEINRKNYEGSAKGLKDVQDFCAELVKELG